MSAHPCSGCGLRSCDGRCFDESPSDYAVDPNAEFRAVCKRADEQNERALRFLLDKQRNA